MGVGERGAELAAAVGEGLAALEPAGLRCVVAVGRVMVWPCPTVRTSFRCLCIVGEVGRIFNPFFWKYVHDMFS